MYNRPYEELTSFQQEQVEVAKNEKETQLWKSIGSFLAPMLGNYFGLQV